MTVSEHLHKEERVALFIPNMHGGGAERMMVILANAFAARGVCVDLVLVQATGRYWEELSPDVRLVDLGAKRLLTSLPKLISYLKNYRPYAMLSTLTFANIISTWACKWVDNPPRLVLREANTISAISSQSSRLKDRLIPRLTSWFYPWADQIVAISKAAREDLIRTTGVPSERVTTIYNPVVTDELFAKAKEEVGHPWFSTTGPPIILGTGRLEPQKDFETLIRAFHRVRNTREARLVILGEGSERRNLERLVCSLSLEGDISMPGFVNNPFCYMANADLFVFSSKFEGLGNALIEAMAVGCPVVSTNCPNGPYEILEGGRWGRLAPVGDEVALASAILETLKQPTCAEEEIRDRAMAFSSSKAVDRYLQVLQT